MSSPENTQRRILQTQEATLLRGRGIDERDPLLVVDALLKEVQMKGSHEVSGVVTVAVKDLEIEFMKPETKKNQAGEEVHGTLARHRMTDLLQSLLMLRGKNDAEMVAALKELKMNLSDNRRSA